MTLWRISLVSLSTFLRGQHSFLVLFILSMDYHQKQQHIWSSVYDLTIEPAFSHYPLVHFCTAEALFVFCFFLRLKPNLYPSAGAPVLNPSLRGLEHVQIKCGRLFMHVRVNKRKQNEMKKKEKFWLRWWRVCVRWAPADEERVAGEGGGEGRRRRPTTGASLSLAGGEGRSKGPPRPWRDRQTRLVCSRDSIFTSF